LIAWIFHLSKHWIFIVFRSTDTFDDLVKPDIFCDLCKERIQ